MLRPPSAPSSRPSVAPSTFGGSSSSANSRIIAKKKEYDTVAALEQNADALRNTFLTFAKQMRQAEEGAESIGSVLANWPHMFAIIGSFANKHEAATTALAETDSEFEQAEDPPPTSLVRVEVTDPQSDKSAPR